MIVMPGFGNARIRSWQTGLRGDVDTVMVAGRIRKRHGELRFRGLEEKKRLLARPGRRILEGVRLAG